MQRHSKLIITLACASLLTTGAWAADAPVVDLNQDNQDNAAQSLPTTDNFSAADQPASAVRQDLPIEERVKLLEQQLSNLVQMNLPAKIDGLQQQIQQLNGQIEVQTHNIQQLTDQQTKFYQDLDGRITKLSAGNTASTETSKAVTAASTANQIAQAESNVTNNTTPPPATEKASATATKAAADVSKAGSEEDAYQIAFGLLTAKKNPEAISAFKTFLTAYPQGTYTANAYYWLGQLYRTTGNNTLAAQQFTTFIAKYPDNTKVADAMLKLAIIHDEAGQHAQARKELKKIIQQFPGTSSARLANMQLQQQSNTTTGSTSSTTTVSPAQ